jgi:hypothetical protein
MFDACTRRVIGPIVLRWVVHYLRNGAALDVQDARDSQEEIVLGELLQDVTLDDLP